MTAFNFRTTCCSSISEWDYTCSAEDVIAIPWILRLYSSAGTSSRLNERLNAFYFNFVFSFVGFRVAEARTMLFNVIEEDLDLFHLSSHRTVPFFCLNQFYEEGIFMRMDNNFALPYLRNR